jgi:hypothetical protein
MPKVATEVNPDEEVETKPTVRSDPGLAKLVANWKQLDTTVKNNTIKRESYVVEMVRYIKDNELSRAVVRKTLEEKGLTEGSLNSTVSRLIALTKPENETILEKLESGEFTQAQVRVAIAKRQENPASAQRTVLDLVKERLLSAAKRAFSDPATVGGVAAFRDLASEAWEAAKADALAKAAKKPVTNGDGEGEGEAQAE